MSDIVNTVGGEGIEERVSVWQSLKTAWHAGELIDLVRATPERVQGIGDDWVQDTDKYNVFGAIYSGYPRDGKDIIVENILGVLDRLNYFYVQLNHTRFIREPLLLSDIGIARKLYWPGLDEGKMLAKSYSGNGETIRFSTFQEFYGVMMKDRLFDRNKVKSDFLVAYALLRNDCSMFGEEFAEACNPAFLDRVVKGIVGLWFGHPKADSVTSTNRLRDLLPESLYRKIDEHRDARDWIDAVKFGGP